MKKVFYSLIVLASVWLLAACSSEEAEEVLDYHNDLVDYVNPRMDELIELNAEVFSIASDEDALEIQKNEIIPVLDEIQTYIQSQSPEYEVTITYHELRIGWINALIEGVYLETEAMEGLLEGTLSEEEVWELFLLSEEAVEQSIKYDEVAYERWEEIKEEFQFEDVEE